MPQIIAGTVDTEALEPGMLSRESTWRTATNIVQLSGSEWIYLADLTIELELEQPAAVLQIVQTNFWVPGAYQPFAIRVLHNGLPSSETIARAAVDGGRTQNVFMQWLWAGLGVGSHTFSAQVTAAKVSARKHAVIILRA